MARSISRLSLLALMLIPFAWAMPVAGQDTSGTKSCTWDASKAPQLFGFRLGMSPAEVITQFPDVPELAAMLQERDMQRVMRGREAILTIVTSIDGSKTIHVTGRYIQTRSDPEGVAGQVTYISLSLNRKEIHTISVHGWTSPAWKSRAAFLDYVSKTYEFSPSWWKARGSPPPPFNDYMVETDDLQCSGFDVKSGCLRGSPPGHCGLRVELRQ